LRPPVANIESALAELEVKPAVRLRNGAAWEYIAVIRLIDGLNVADTAIAELRPAKPASAGPATKRGGNAGGLGEVKERSGRRRPDSSHVATGERYRECRVRIARQVARR
jgi:hypothetical protein